jgi:hypothetical protein
MGFVFLNVTSFGIMMNLNVRHFRKGAIVDIIAITLPLSTILLLDCRIVPKVLYSRSTLKYGVQNLMQLKLIIMFRVYVLVLSVASLKGRFTR